MAHITTHRQNLKGKMLTKAHRSVLGGKRRGKQSNPTCIAMRHDKIISSTQIHAVCFFRLIAKADLSCFISRTGEGSTREAEKVEEEREGETEEGERKGEKE